MNDSVKAPSAAASWSSPNLGLPYQQRPILRFTFDHKVSMGEQLRTWKINDDYEAAMKGRRIYSNLHYEKDLERSKPSGCKALGFGLGRVKTPRALFCVC